MPVPEPLECRLDADGMRRQRDRYAALRPVHVAREPQRLVVRFAAGDEALLTETLAVERACCPFFTIEQEGRMVTFSVAPEHDPALDAIAEALRGLPARRGS
jgi:hypothetical protein